MNTQEIDEILMNDKETAPHFRGTFSWDTVPDLDEGDSCVVNTHCQELRGEHWIVYLYMDGKLQFFDSYGEHPSRYPGLPQKVDEFNDRQIQNIDSQVCGHYCVLFLLNRYRGFEMSEFLNMFTGDLHDNDHKVARLLGYLYNVKIPVHI